MRGLMCWPPVSTLTGSPATLPDVTATRSGVRKYSEMPSRSAWADVVSSHISRKKAIMAVTKSA